MLLTGFELPTLGDDVQLAPARNRIGSTAEQANWYEPKTANGQKRFVRHRNVGLRILDRQHSTIRLSRAVAHNVAESKRPLVFVRDTQAPQHIEARP